MGQLSNLTPQPVWDIFEEITRVPRPSKKEEKIRQYLIDFAKKYNLAYKTDTCGNVMIAREASPSMADKPAVVLQSHMDMVCEKNSDIQFDFDNDPIRVVVTPDGWVKADGTTLGADDGIGMAAALAVLTDDSLTVPRIEALFTVDEETGLTGAFNLGEDMLTGKYLINLDSEDEGEIFIGCAGGIDTLATFTYTTGQVPDGHLFFRIDIKGLKGGHSGDDIDKGLANSNKLSARLLRQAITECGALLCRIDGGNLRNAIPREAYAVVAVPAVTAKHFFAVFEKFREQVTGEYSITEPGMDITLTEVPAQEKCISRDDALRLIDALNGVPNGVLAMSFAMPGLVETSSNLASVKQSDDNKIVVTTSQRSSVEGARINAAMMVESVMQLAGAEVMHSDGYPGWNPDPNSHLLAVTKKCYTELFDEQPKVRAIHAGLECGLFLEKYPHLEMVSIGPTLRGVHSPDERMEISTVDKFWKLLVEMLRSI